MIVKSSLVTTNIAVVELLPYFTDQVPDPSWSLVDTSIEGHEVDPPFLAIRRNIDSHRLDYIIDVTAHAVWD